MSNFAIVSLIIATFSVVVALYVHFTTKDEKHHHHDNNK